MSNYQGSRARKKKQVIVAVTKILVKKSIIYRDQKFCSSFGIIDAKFNKSKMEKKKQIPFFF